MDKSRRSVGLWLLFVAAAVLVQVGLGGITRLTDSGLSITEWRPLLGVIPPLDEAGWREAFAKYQQLPQFVQLKSHLSLDDFKQIYFWEWFHRLWGRLLGFFFIVPLIVFWRRGLLGGLRGRLLGLFLLGGAQGALGWFMVMSGLDTLVYVSHLRLAAHYMAAMGLFGALLWYGAELAWPRRPASDPGLRRASVALLVALAVQLTWGGFMAGLKAAFHAPTWPTINGQWFPDGSLSAAPWNQPLAVHFIHRNLAYALLVALGWWWWRARTTLGLERHAVLGLAVLQVLLGIATVYYGPRGHMVTLGLVHQLVGTALFGSLVLGLRALTPSSGIGTA